MKDGQVHNFSPYSIQFIAVERQRPSSLISQISAENVEGRELNTCLTRICVSYSANCNSTRVITEHKLQIAFASKAVVAELMLHE